MMLDVYNVITVTVQERVVSREGGNCEGRVAAGCSIAHQLLHVVSLDRCIVTIYRETRGLS